MKRFLSFFLVILMMASAVACRTSVIGGDETRGTETDAGETSSAEYVPPVRDFDGESFKVVFRYGTVAYDIDDIFVEEAGDNIVSQAVYNRNSRLERNFNIVFDFNLNANPTQYTRTDALTTDGMVDVVSDQMTALFPLGAEDALYNWNDLDYVDMENPWWDQNAAKELSILNKLYVAVCNVSLSAFAGARFIYYNKDILQEIDMDVNVYQLVNDNEWTFDSFSSIVKKAGSDLNGDNAMDGNDRYGLMYEHPLYQLVGLGLLLSEKNSDDIPELTCINSTGEKKLSTLTGLLSDRQNVIFCEDAWKGMNTSGYKHNFDWLRGQFVNGHYLFIQNGANVAYQFANMESPYGILPNPKYDENQESYYHLIDIYTCAWGISGCTTHLDMVEMLMEYWAYDSSEMVEAFFEKTMKGRRTDMPEDAAMLDIVKNTMRYEITHIYDCGVGNMFLEAVKTGNLMSTYAKYEDTIKTRMSALVDAFEIAS